MVKRNGRQDNNGPQNTTHKTTKTQQKPPGCELMCSGRVGNSFSISCTYR